MHITQIMFKGESKDKELLEKALKNHEEAANYSGYVSHEVWINETNDSYAFSLNITWESKDDFDHYFVESHKGKDNHKNMRKENVQIKKTLNHFNMVKKQVL